MIVFKVCNVEFHTKFYRSLKFFSLCLQIFGIFFRFLSNQIDLESNANLIWSFLLFEIKKKIVCHYSNLTYSPDKERSCTYAFYPVVNINAADADHTSQVYSPFSCVFAVIWDCTLASNCCTISVFTIHCICSFESFHCEAKDCFPT